MPPQVLTTAASLAAAALEGAHVTPALLKETTKGHKGVEKNGRYLSYCILMERTWIYHAVVIEN